MSAFQLPDGVSHNEDRHRFEIHDGAYTATLQYQRDGDRVIFTHTHVPDLLRGHGVATKLSRGALHAARHLHWKVTAQCPFVAVFLERNRGFADLVDTQGKESDGAAGCRH